MWRGGVLCASGTRLALTKAERKQRNLAILPNRQTIPRRVAIAHGLCSAANDGCKTPTLSQQSPIPALWEQTWG